MTPNLKEMFTESERQECAVLLAECAEKLKSGADRKAIAPDVLSEVSFGFVALALTAAKRDTREHTVLLEARLMAAELQLRTLRAELNDLRAKVTL